MEGESSLTGSKVGEVGVVLLTGCLWWAEDGVGCEGVGPREL